MNLSDQDISRLFETRDSFYRHYTIPKPNGKRRYIQEPTGELKDVQKHLLQFFSQAKLHPAATARSGVSAAKNARLHSNAKHVLKVDILNCYLHTTSQLILDNLPQVAPSQEWLEYATRVLPLCLLKVYDEEVLPTGAPTSPSLCNIALTNLDYNIEKLLAGSHRYVYSRYIDDLCISTSSHQRDWSILNQVEAILQASGYKVSRRKTRWLTVNDSDNVEITGIRIGKQSIVPRKLRRNVRAKLEYLAKTQLPLDEQARGYLSYLYSLDPHEHIKMLQYYQTRLNRATIRQINGV